MTEPEAKNESAVVEGYPPRSTADLMLLIGAITAMFLSIMASGGAIVSGWINSARVEARVTQASEKAVQKLEVIDKQTNSHLTSLSERLERSHSKIETLEKMLVEEKEKEKEKEP